MTVAPCPNCQAMNEQLVRAHELKLSAEDKMLQHKREATRLYNELHKQKVEDPESVAAKEILEHWVHRLGKDPKKTKIPLTGKRADVVRRALGWKYDTVQLKKAIDGLALRPHVGSRGRSAEPYPGSTPRHTDVEHALGTERRIEECVGYVDQASEPPTPSPRHWDRIDKQAQRRLDAATDDLSGAVNGHRLNTYQGAAREEPIIRVLARLERDNCHVTPMVNSQCTAQCPAHDDSSPSLRIKEADDGAVLMKCMAGCETEHVLHALELEWADIGGRA